VSPRSFSLVNPVVSTAASLVFEVVTVSMHGHTFYYMRTKHVDPALHVRLCGGPSTGTTEHTYNLLECKENHAIGMSSRFNLPPEVSVR
jgi:hypothetical protein